MPAEIATRLSRTIGSRVDGVADDTLTTAAARGRAENSGEPGEL